MKIVVDSYAWVEVFRGGDKGKTALEVMGHADELMIPDLVLAELARKFAREGLNEKEGEELLDHVVRTSRIAGVGEKTALLATKCYFELAAMAKEKRLGDPSLFDAAILAIAREIGGKVLTRDAHFRDFPETIWLGREERAHYPPASVRVLESLRNF
ncbi:PIN domain-containing protein [Tardisphaera saccharovorans]